MKKTMLSVMLGMLLVLGAYAQKAIDEVDGYDWVTFSDAQQAGLIQGYYIACSTILNMTYELNESSKNVEELMETMERSFLYQETVGAMIQKLDDYYASPAVRKFRLYRTIPFLAGKEWWNRQTGVVEGI